MKKGMTMQVAIILIAGVLLLALLLVIAVFLSKEGFPLLDEIVKRLQEMF